jgi:hypothetical protein
MLTVNLVFLKTNKKENSSISHSHVKKYALLQKQKKKKKGKKRKSHPTFQAEQKKYNLQTVAGK